MTKKRFFIVAWPISTYVIGILLTISFPMKFGFALFDVVLMEIGLFLVVVGMMKILLIPPSDSGETRESKVGRVKRWKIPAEFFRPFALSYVLATIGTLLVLLAVKDNFRSSEIGDMELYLVAVACGMATIVLSVLTRRQGFVINGALFLGTMGICLPDRDLLSFWEINFWVAGTVLVATAAPHIIWDWRNAGWQADN